MKLLRRITPWLVLLCSVVASPAALAQEERRAQSAVREGIKVEFTIEPLAAGGGVVAGEDAVVRFRVSDTATGTPLSGARPAAWMSRRETPAPADAAQCKEQIQSFVQGSLRARPDVDLNSYVILALNQEANVSVIDPLLGFGGSRLLALVPLDSPGEDWALAADGARLFVSMPQAGRVAVVDTRTWRAAADIETGGRPTRLALQPDGKYLWVVDDAGGGVAVIDAAASSVAARIKTGAGPHEVAFSGDNRFAFVSNRDDGTLSVIDVGGLSKLKDVKTGAPATALAYSPLSRAVYAADGGDGGIAVVDAASQRVLTRIAARPGIVGLRFAPGGRWGFATNPAESAVHIFDASTNRLAHTVIVGKRPERVSFTAAFAYVRSAGTEEVTAIRLSTVGKEPDVVKFSGGQLAPGDSAAAAADAIVPAPEGNSVLVANPSDRMIYYYTEGMAAPMGNFQNYRRAPRAVLVVDRSLRETSPGVYATNVRLPKGGAYTVSLLLDSPRITHCFEAEAKHNPKLDADRRAALRVEYLDEGKRLRVGETHRVRFKLFDTATGQPAADLKDVRVIAFLAPGTWQTRALARPAGAGVYEMDFEVPQPGVYMVFVESPSRGVAFRQLPHLTLQAEAAPDKPAN
jgi:YVTN family beta-propeller protein